MEKLIAGAKQWNIDLSDQQVEQFRLYRQEIQKWNQSINLTAIDDDEGIIIRHFLDSLSCVLAMRQVNHIKGECKLVDIGAGAGFPGIPLKIAFPSLQVTLVEATGKKSRFLDHMIDLLDLSGVESINSRAEDLGHSIEHREQYDWTVARAVADLPVLLEYMLPLTQIGGFSLAQKGEKGPEEVSRADRALSVLGGKLIKVLPAEIHGLAETRHLILVEKIATTPAKYPRRPGMPTKRPLV
ncbi:MAG: 16S rRNA (guanine(527)-N(7))-methyltransferase RsmG [Chloroflexota bacterium]